MSLLCQFCPRKWFLTQIHSVASLIFGDSAIYWHIWGDLYHNIFQIFNFIKNKQTFFSTFTQSDSTWYVSNEICVSVVWTSHWKEERHKINSSVNCNNRMFETVIQNTLSMLQTHTHTHTHTQIVIWNVNKSRITIITALNLVSSKWQMENWRSSVYSPGFTGIYLYNTAEME